MHNFIKKIFNPTKRLDIVVLFVEYERGSAGGVDHTFATLQQYLQSVTGCRFLFLRIDNKKEDGSLNKFGQVWKVSGDNRYREFSGWQKGIEIIDRCNIPCDLLLFVNDMFLTPGESFLKDYARSDLFKKSLTNRAIIGRIDTTGHHYTAYEYNVSQWVCTNCFLAPREAVVALGALETIKENINDFLEVEFPGPHSPLFKSSAPMNDPYKDWLEEWLTTKWHSRFELNEDNWDLFRNKVRNILNEALLTARFQKAGFRPLSYGDRKYY